MSSIGGGGGGGGRVGGGSGAEPATEEVRVRSGLTISKLTFVS